MDSTAVSWRLPPQMLDTRPTGLGVAAVLKMLQQLVGDSHAVLEGWYW